MNLCKEQHVPKYKVKYKTTSNKYNPIWLVCPDCLENKPCFGDKTSILSVVMI